MKFLQSLYVFLAVAATAVILSVIVDLVSPVPITSRPAAAEPSNQLSQCCSDCTDIKRFIDAICEEAGGIPPVRSVCNKYRGD